MTKKTTKKTTKKSTKKATKGMQALKATKPLGSWSLIDKAVEWDDGSGNKRTFIGYVHFDGIPCACFVTEWAETRRDGESFGLKVIRPLGSQVERAHLTVAAEAEEPGTINNVIQDKLDRCKGRKTSNGKPVKPWIFPLSMDGEPQWEEMTTEELKGFQLVDVDTGEVQTWNSSHQAALAIVGAIGSRNFSVESSEERARVAKVSSLF